MTLLHCLRLCCQQLELLKKFITLLTGCVGVIILSYAKHMYVHLSYLHVQLYSIIGCMQVPEIDSSSDKGLTPDKFDSFVQLKDVFFSYPTRPDVHVR